MVFQRVEYCENSRTAVACLNLRFSQASLAKGQTVKPLASRLARGFSDGQVFIFLPVPRLESSIRAVAVRPLGEPGIPLGFPPCKRKRLLPENAILTYTRQEALWASWSAAGRLPDLKSEICDRAPPVRND